jgi:hypothetical protein
LNKKELTFFICSFLFLLSLIPIIKFNLGGLDSYSHYFQSLHASKEPRLFFDSWGRPLFITLSFPFTFFLKYFGLKLFNVILGFLTAIITYSTAKEMKLKKQKLGFFLTLLSPYLFWGMYSGLTDVLLGFFVILSFYLFIIKKYKLSSLILGLALLSRDEALIVIVIFILVFILLKKWLAIFLPALPLILLKVLNKIFAPSYKWELGQSYVSYWKEMLLPRMIKVYIEKSDGSISYALRITSQLLFNRLLVYIVKLIILVNPIIFFGSILGASSILSQKWDLKNPKFIMVAIIGLSIITLMFFRITQFINAGATVRYFIFLTPFFVLLTLIGLEKQNKRWVIILSSLFLFLSIISVASIKVYWPFYIFIVIFLTYLFIPKKLFKRIFLLTLIVGSPLLLIMETSSKNIDHDYDLGKEINTWLEEENLFEKEIWYSVNTIALHRNLDCYDRNSKFKYFYTVSEAELKEMEIGTIIIYQIFYLTDGTRYLIQSGNFEIIKEFSNTKVYRKIA